MKRAFALILSLLALQLPVSHGQTPFFQQYYPLEKTQPVEVNALLQDRQGFIWLGTNKGLFRFDGITYNHFAEADRLPDINVTALAEDSLGRIWMGHRSGQLSYLDHGTVTEFEAREGAAIKPVSDILFDREGRMWFSTLNDGLYYFVGDRLYRVDEQEGMPDLFVYDLFEDQHGNILAGTDGGLAICRLTNRQISIDVVDSEDGLTDIIIKKIRHFHGDTVSLATEDAGVLNYNMATRQFAPLADKRWSYGSVSDLVVTDNQVWISTPRSGLVVYDRKAGRFKLFGKVDNQSLLSVNTLMRDVEGNIWAGSKHGLTRTLGDAVEHLDILDPCKDINILALTVDRNDRLWFVSREGLFVQTPDPNGQAKVSRKLQNTRFKDATIISLYADDHGYIWAGLFGDGLLRIHPETGSVKHFREELRNGNVLGITGRGDVIWLATLGGSTRIDVSGAHITFKNYSSADGLSSDFIYQVFIDSQGRTWFATDGRGVTMLDDKGFHHFVKGLGSTVVYSFAEDVNHDIWVTAQDNGVYRLSGSEFVEAPEFRLREKSVQSLVADETGNLLAMHNFGIDVYDISKKQTRYWGEETGIRDKHPNLNAVARDQYGRFYIGTNRGIIKVSLANDTALHVPRSAIDAVKVYNEAIDLSKTLRFSHDRNNITVHYLGLWYQNAGSLNYRYKLENYDMEWIQTRDQDVTYSILPPGDYTFRVKVSDTDDFSHAAESTLSFSITPPFWRTSPFYVFVIALFVIGAYGLIRFRERKLLEDKLVLEARVEERTREIQMKTEEIQAQNEEIMAQAEEIQGINENLEMLVKQRTAELEKKNQALEEYAFINAHKLRGPVASILGLLNLLKQCKPDDDTSAIHRHLQQSAEKLDEVVRSITKAIENADNEYL